MCIMARSVLPIRDRSPCSSPSRWLPIRRRGGRVGPLYTSSRKSGSQSYSKPDSPIGSCRRPPRRRPMCASLTSGVTARSYLQRSAPGVPPSGRRPRSTSTCARCCRLGTTTPPTTTTRAPMLLCGVARTCACWTPRWRWGYLTPAGLS